MNTSDDTSFVHIDTGVFVVFPYDYTQYWMFKNCKPVELTDKDYETIEQVLRTSIMNYNQERTRYMQTLSADDTANKFNQKDFIIDLNRYKRQYVAVVNAKGEKEVWVNCFCGNFTQESRTSIVEVNDGGNCYFSVKINLTNKMFYDFYVNGEA